MGKSTSLPLRSCCIIVLLVIAFMRFTFPKEFAWALNPLIPAKISSKELRFISRVPLSHESRSVGNGLNLTSKRLDSNLSKKQKGNHTAKGKELVAKAQTDVKDSQQLGSTRKYQKVAEDLTKASSNVAKQKSTTRIPVEDVPYEVLALLKKLHTPFATEEFTDELVRQLYAPSASTSKLKNSCKCRMERSQYHRKVVEAPSSHLKAVLRQYAAFHARCTTSLGGPTGAIMRATADFLPANKTDRGDCRYLVFMEASNGLGNKLMGLVSSFVQAILTQRVLLLPPEAPMPYLLCEPFERSSWKFPEDFPVRFLDSAVSMGDFVRAFASAPPGRDASWLPAIVSVNYGQFFYCTRVQEMMHKVPWLLMDSNVYHLPELLLIPEFRRTVEAIFPKKGLIFTYLSRYLFLPQDKIWKRIKAAQYKYMNFSKRQVAFHIRYLVYENLDMWENHADHLNHINQRVLECAINVSKILPPPVAAKDDKKPGKGGLLKDGVEAMASKKTSVFVASQFADVHAVAFKETFLAGDEIQQRSVVAVKHLTAEHEQGTDLAAHERALIEMWLLSFADELVTSSNSTFSYVAQGLGGHKSWVLNFRPQAELAACTRRVNSEPCHLNFIFERVCERFEAKSSRTGTRIPSGIGRCPDRDNSLMFV